MWIYPDLDSETTTAFRGNTPISFFRNLLIFLKDDTKP